MCASVFNLIICFYMCVCSSDSHTCSHSRSASPLWISHKLTHTHTRIHSWTLIYWNFCSMVWIITESYTHTRNNIISNSKRKSAYFTRINNFEVCVLVISEIHNHTLGGNVAIVVRKVLNAYQHYFIGHTINVNQQTHTHTRNW